MRRQCVPLVPQLPVYREWQYASMCLCMNRTYMYYPFAKAALIFVGTLRPKRKLARLCCVYNLELRSYELRVNTHHRFDPKKYAMTAVCISASIMPCSVGSERREEKDCRRERRETYVTAGKWPAPCAYTRNTHCRQAYSRIDALCLQSSTARPASALASCRFRSATSCLSSRALSLAVSATR